MTSLNQPGIPEANQEEGCDKQVCPGLSSALPVIERGFYVSFSKVLGHFGLNLRLLKASGEVGDKLKPAEHTIGVTKRKAVISKLVWGSHLPFLL